MTFEQYYNLNKVEFDIYKNLYPNFWEILFTSCNNWEIKTSNITSYKGWFLQNKTRLVIAEHQLDNITTDVSGIKSLDTLYTTQENEVINDTMTNTNVQEKTENVIAKSNNIGTPLFDQAQSDTTNNFNEETNSNKGVDRDRTNTSNTSIVDVGKYYNFIIENSMVGYVLEDFQGLFFVRIIDIVI